MSQVKSGVKHLRIALKQGPKITEDKTLKDRASVTVGQAATNTFVVPVSQLPSSFMLFESVAGAYSLVFTANMEGEVSGIGGDKRTLESLRTTGQAKPRKDLQGPRQFGRRVYSFSICHAPTCDSNCGASA
jgi:hypothetical protein